MKNIIFDYSSPMYAQSDPALRKHRKILQKRAAQYSHVYNRESYNSNRYNRCDGSVSDTVSLIKFIFSQILNFSSDNGKL